MKPNRIRYATKSDLDYFFPEGQPYSSRAWILEGVERHAIGGIWLIPEKHLLFIKTNKNLPKKTLFVEIRRILKELLKEGSLYCYRDVNEPNSKRFLEKLGFQYQGIIQNKEIYKLWQQQQYH